jgi:nitroreductase
MTFLELVKKRASIRGYQNTPVENEKLEYILEAGRLAPSAANLQPWRFIVIRDQQLKEELYRVYRREWFMQAPVIIVLCGDHSESWKRADGKDHCDIDVAIATDHMTLAAAEKDLGTCWVCNFDARLCSGILQLPENLEPIVLLSVGYPATELDLSRHVKRKDITEILHREGFNQ